MPLYQASEFKVLLKEVQAGSYLPVYLFYGDRYLCQSAAKDLISAILPQSSQGTNLRVIDWDKEDVHRLIEDLKTYPFFGGRQVFFLKDTRLFSSKTASGSLMEKSCEQFTQGNLDKAAELFLRALSLFGLTLGDIQDGISHGFTEKAWNKVFGPDAGDDKAWVEQITGYILKEGMHEIKPGEDGARLLEEALSRGIPASNHLIMLADAVDKRLALYGTVEKLGAVINFEAQKGITAAAKRSQDQLLKDMVQDLTGHHGKSIKAPAVQNLIEKLGFNPSNLAGTLEKLINYVGSRAVITEKDVDAVVRREREEPIFELMKAFGDKNMEGAIWSLNRLLDQNLAPLQILAALIKLARRLLLARWALNSKLGVSITNARYDEFNRVLPQLKKEGKIPKGLEDMSAYPLFLLLKQAAGFTLEQLKELMSDLLHIDMTIKSGGPEPRLLLENLIFKHLSNFAKKAAAVR